MFGSFVGSRHQSEARGSLPCYCFGDSTPHLNFKRISSNSRLDNQGAQLTTRSKRKKICLR
jgi:hypothetical protein